MTEHLCVCGGGGGGNKEKFRASVVSFEEIHVCSYIRNTGKPMKATCQSGNLKLKVKDKTSLSRGVWFPACLTILPVQVQVSKFFNQNLFMYNLILPFETCQHLYKKMQS